MRRAPDAAGGGTTGSTVLCSVVFAANDEVWRTAALGVCSTHALASTGSSAAAAIDEETPRATGAGGPRDWASCSTVRRCGSDNGSDARLDCESDAGDAATAVVDNKTDAGDDADALVDGCG